MIVGQASPGKCDECGFSVGSDGIDLTMGGYILTLCVLCRSELLAALEAYRPPPRRQ